MNLSVYRTALNIRASNITKVWYIISSFILNAFIPIALLPFLILTTECHANPETLRGNESTITAKGINITVNKHATYLTIIFSGKVNADFYAIERPNRLIIDLPDVEFHDKMNNLNKNGGVISSYRYGLFASGRSRIVIDLKQPVSAQALHGITEGDKNHYFSLELKAASTEQYKALVRKTTPSMDNLQNATGFETAVEIPENSKLPVIVIDPGHGGIDPGAITQSGIQEKDIVFAFAQTVAEYLNKQKRFHIVMTRKSDIFIPLGERVRIAQKAQADLFISIHADSISAAPQISGFTVYTMSDKASDRESALLAAKENQADSVAGVESQELKEQVVDILQELTIRETRLLSKRFARFVIDSFGNVMRLNKNPYRQASFHVLKAYDVPSILIELGYLSSAQDINLLTSDEWRNNAAEAIVKSINDFFPDQLSQN